MLEPELVIVSLNTDLYNMKCQLLLLAIENKVLRERLRQITSVVNFVEDKSINCTCDEHGPCLVCAPLNPRLTKAKTVGS